MSYEKEDNKSESYGRFGGPRGGFERGQGGPDGRGPGFGPHWGRQGGGDWFSWAREPGFHPLKAVATVGAFAVFPPLGVLTLGYFLWNSRRGWGPATTAGPGFEGRSFGRGGRCGGGRMGRWSTGNEAFDEHQREQFMKMREERHAFHDYRAAERKKRDQEAFDAFRAAEAAKPTDVEKKED